MARGNDEKNNPRRKVSRADLVMRDLQAIIEGRMAAPKSITQLGLDDTESDDDSEKDEYK